MYNQWLHTTMQQSFKDFRKAQGLKSIRNKEKEPITKEQEQKMFDFATQFVKPNKLKPESEVD
ncbi:peptide methionine sulfoxide reductase [Lapidilactobacillus dextrinicus]|nr:peptide methionine sulfoxide reductase [Lapidilactobacillus dextrinicus]